MSTVETPITETELDAWIVELLHGERKQVKSQLRKPVFNYEAAEQEGFGYCCLGVRCEMVGFDLDATYLSREGDEWSEDVYAPYSEHGGDTADPDLPEPLRGLSVATRRALAEANDSTHTFAEIAAALNLHRATLLAGGDLKFNTIRQEIVAVAA